MSRDTYIPLQNLLVSLNLALSYHHEEKKVKHDEKKNIEVQQFMSII